MGSNRKGLGKSKKGKAQVRTSVPKVRPDFVISYPPMSVAEMRALEDFRAEVEKLMKDSKTVIHTPIIKNVCGVDDCPLCDFISRRKDGPGI